VLNGIKKQDKERAKFDTRNCGDVTVAHGNDARYINVCVEKTGFKPINLEELKK
jgi:hypothetical protein